MRYLYKNKTPALTGEFITKIKEMTEQDMLIETINELRGKLHEVMVSNELLTNSVKFLNAAVNDLTDAIKKK